jgi:3-methylcrotonyl-CoA carboxylase alpha subunit
VTVLALVWMHVEGQPMFKKILIANRGEIACRVAATARRLGVQTVAVYSDADAHARHVRACDEAVHIGGAAPRDSYLRWQASSTPPGHRRAGRAPGLRLPVRERGLRAGLRRCRAGLHRPAAVSAIAAMGSKSAAKALMERRRRAAGARLPRRRQRPGAAGTRGRPHRLPGADQGQRRRRRQGHAPRSRRPRTLPPRWPAASARPRPRSATTTCWSSATCTRPRHIEIQVFGDSHGHVIHLGERDCSVQRRHQKVLEESPAPGLSAARRAEMGAAAVAAAKAVGYVGAGTVEFVAEELTTATSAPTSWR